MKLKNFIRFLNLLNIYFCVFLLFYLSIVVLGIFTDGTNINLLLPFSVIFLFIVVMLIFVNIYFRRFAYGITSKDDYYIVSFKKSSEVIHSKNCEYIKNNGYITKIKYKDIIIRCFSKNSKI